jgi:hypothetical protein
MFRCFCITSIKCKSSLQFIIRSLATYRQLYFHVTTSFSNHLVSGFSALSEKRLFAIGKFLPIAVNWRWPVVGGAAECCCPWQRTGFVFSLQLAAVKSVSPTASYLFCFAKISNQQKATLIARKPAIKSIIWGAGVTRSSLASNCSNTRQLKTSND